MLMNGIKLRVVDLWYGFKVIQGVTNCSKHGKVQSMTNTKLDAKIRFLAHEILCKSEDVMSIRV